MRVSLDQLSGQARAAEHVRSALIAGRLHHALLFSGPDGVGKFRAAEILAQRLVCQNAPLDGDEGAACGECAACVRVQTAGHADIHVLQTDERMIKVDALREATSVLQLRPVEAPMRTLIVRDADKMNPQAQNALLKTLEEPPGDAKIILTSSRPQSILITVLSRCQSVPFLPVPRDSIVELLIDKDVPEESAKLIAALSQGAPGRALETDPAALTEARDQVADLDLDLEPRSKGGVARAIEAAQSLADQAEDLPGLFDLLSIWLRDQILIASGADADVANDDRFDDVAGLAQRRGLTEVLRRARALEIARAQIGLPQNLNKFLIAEQLCLSFVGQPTTQRIPRI